MKRNKTLAIFTLVEHKELNGQYYGYAPYISEMNMWSSHFDNVIVVGPYTDSKSIDDMELSYSHQNLKLIKVPSFNIKSIYASLKLLTQLPFMFVKMFKTMNRADHLHFRCPSNVSAVAALVQVFFPNKPKSTKYAGNWNPKDNQPIGYRFQKWLLANRFLTKNMKVLVYGDYPDQSKSVVPFMSATYRDDEKIPFVKRDFSVKLKFVFIGAMVVGKRPKLTVKIIEAIKHKGFEVELHMFGDGDLIDDIKSYVNNHHLEKDVIIYGNRDKSEVKSCLKDAHFTILPSKSEGWPKAIAEGMFFGAIPISTKISCLPWILGYGNRGILISEELDEAVSLILNQLDKGDEYLNDMANNALIWAQEYTLERLSKEIETIAVGQ